jgi:hypothetical protein
MGGIIDKAMKTSIGTIKAVFEISLIEIDLKTFP